MELDNIILEYGKKLEKSNSIKRSFQNAFLEIALRRYGSEVETRNDAYKKKYGKKSLTNNLIEEINTEQNSMIVTDIVCVVRDKVNVLLKRNPSEQKWGHRLLGWFPNYKSKKADKNGRMPSKQHLYELAVLLNWSLSDFNKMVSALSLQTSGFNGSMFESVYHYALMYNKTYDWAEQTLIDIDGSNEKTYDGDIHLTSGTNFTVKFRNAIEKVFKELEEKNEKGVPEEVREEYFVNKMNEWKPNFNKNSLNMVSVIRAVNAGCKALSNSAFCALFGYLESEKRLGDVFFDEANVNKVLSDITPKGRTLKGKFVKKKTEKTNRVPTRELLVLCSLARFCYDLTIRKDYESMAQYINSNLTYAEFEVLDASKSFDSFILELSKFSVDEQRKCLVYEGSEVSNLHGFEEFELPGGSKKDVVAKYVAYLIQMYEEKLCLSSIAFADVELTNTRLRTVYKG